MSQMHSETPNNARTAIAVTRQLNQLKQKAPDGIHILINDTDIFDIQADIYGPIGTPYEDGVFRCKLVLPSDFPLSPPKGFFHTKIFHPNISDKGEICVNTLKKDWNPQNWSFYNIFEVIKCLLIIPFPESALNEEAGKQFMENYEEYFKYAKLMTNLHARIKTNNEGNYFEFNQKQCKQNMKMYHQENNVFSEGQINNVFNAQQSNEIKNQIINSNWNQFNNNNNSNNINNSNNLNNKVQINLTFNNFQNQDQIQKKNEITQCDKSNNEKRKWLNRI